MKYSVKTEADFCPPAGAGAPADRGQGGPAEFRGPCCTPVTPEAPVAAGVPCIIRRSLLSGLIDSCLGEIICIQKVSKSTQIMHLNASLS